MMASGGDDLIVTLQGSAVVPGDIVSRLPTAQSSTGTTKRPRDEAILAVICGTVVWDGDTVSVAPRSVDATPRVAETTSAGSSSAAPLGPRAGDRILTRIVRVGKTQAFGDIVAINGAWTTRLSNFRGVLRAEDIRPFKPTDKQPTVPAASLSMRCGDLVAAQVLSQADAKLYQLTTIPPSCGVIEANADDPMRRVRSHRTELLRQGVLLQHVARRRDVMRNPITGEDVSRWAPMLEA